jgi:hypothetical protein
MGAKSSGFKVQHTNFNILISTVFIYIDLAALKALLNKYTDPPPPSFYLVCNMRYSLKPSIFI